MSIAEKGLILKVINSKESDRSLVILTEHGLVSAYAKSARNIKNKKFAIHLKCTTFCLCKFPFGYCMSSLIHCILQKELEHNLFVVFFLARFRTAYF